LRQANIKETFIKAMIQDIVAGKYHIGDKLPPERELSETLGISRIVIHSGMVELCAKGLLRIVPRKGIYVNDYILHGGIAIIDVLFTDSPKLDPIIFLGMIQARALLETEFASLAAKHRSEVHLKRLNEIVSQEKAETDLETIVHLDFAFHHEIAHASGNVIYPMILKSMEATYENLIRAFYLQVKDRTLVLASHEALVNAIENQYETKARTIMTDILAYGFAQLRSQAMVQEDPR